MNQSSTNIKHQQLKNEFENESKMNSIINFWKNFNPRRLKVEPCSFDFEQNINFFFFKFYFKNDLEKSHHEILQKRLHNKKNSSKLFDLVLKLKNEIAMNVNSTPQFLSFSLSNTIIHLEC